MKPNRLRFLWLSLLAAVFLCVGGYLVYDRGRPLPVPVSETIRAGVEYQRLPRFSPRPMIIHVLTIDMRTSGLRFVVTPPDDPEADLPLRARTTSQFLTEFNMDIAINGDGFTPWWSRGPTDYYPKVGDPVAPLGDTASLGTVYWHAKVVEPTLYISSRNTLSFDAPARPYNALSGGQMLLTGGNPVDGLNDTDLHPRTAIGYNKNGRYLYLVVVDGRQPFYSEGIKLTELAQVMKQLGAYYAMNLDGGGSSTMVVRGQDGMPRILNSPIDQYIPGRERAVANHLGIYFRK